MTAGIAAGQHYDPEGKKSHKGPKGAGHKGDLPALNASAKGDVNQAVTAPHLKLADVQGRSLVIHEGGDNYSDTPESGGGKGRIACGVIPRVESSLFRTFGLGRAAAGPGSGGDGAHLLVLQQFHVQVSLGRPFAAGDVAQPRRGQVQCRLPVGEGADDTRSPADLAQDAL